METKTDLLSLYPEELEQYVLAAGEPKYRALQLFRQFARGKTIREMSDIGKRSAENLERNGYVFFPETVKKLVSERDGTVKYLFGLSDSNRIETVLMRYRHGNTVCVSTQVGCAMGCKFCASTIGGKVRNLNPGEILAQVIAAQKDTGERISNIVLMGIGEPLDNYDSVVKFMRLANDERGLNIGYRHISVSTCGLVKGIERLASENLPVTLSVSLHASDDAVRSEIMPVNSRYGISELLGACRKYYAATKRRISFEYALIKNKNDGIRDAVKLAKLLNAELNCGDRRMPVHVNLIPVNGIEGGKFAAPDRKRIKAFAEALERNGIRATVRRTLGPDINASCGQLRRGESE